MTDTLKYSNDDVMITRNSEERIDSVHTLQLLPLYTDVLFNWSTFCS